MTNSIYCAIALDLGTTSIKAGLLDQDGVIRHIVTRQASKVTANNGRYESDALAYAKTADSVLDACIAHAGDCTTLGLCSQRSSFLVWEQATGRPLTPLISWQDNRGAASCEALREHEKLIRDLTGLPLTPYYFAPKLRTVLQENPGWKTRLERSELLVGTLDTFLIWRWSSGKHFVTDASMAARTLLMDIGQQHWSPALCDLFGINTQILPKIISSAGMKIKMDNGLVLQASVGDQSAALFASVKEASPGNYGNDVLANLGTGCFVVRYLADDQTASNGYLQTLVYQDNTGHAHYAIEGTLNSVASALAPYAVAECRVEDFASSDIFCLAEPSGLGAPYFRSDLGIRFSQPVEYLTQRRIAILLLEAVVFRVARILEDFHRESAIERVFLSGGLSELICLQQGIAQCAPCDVYRLSQVDSSLHGAALLAAEMLPAGSRKHIGESQLILKAGEAPALLEKYRRWKLWLDALLIS